MENTQTLDLNEIFSVEEIDDETILQIKKINKKLIIYDPGLYHTAICKSQISKIDKKDGKLYYRGMSAEKKIDDDFLDVAFEIIFGLDNQKREFFKQSVFDHFQLLPEQKNLIDSLPLSNHPMDFLSISTIALAGIENKYLKDPLDLIEKAAFIIAQVAVTVSYLFLKLNLRQDNVSKALLPYSELIMKNMQPHETEKRLKKLGKILNTIMILHAEHGQNCSSATVRNIASSRGNIYTAVAAGMSAFNGSLHGGASQFVSTMYEELIEKKLDIDQYVDEKISKKELIMGFGQRTYNKILNCWDPRVEVMNKILTEELNEFPEINKYKIVAQKLIERVVNDPFFKARNLTPNPDLFNCIFYKLFGAPKEMNTTMLALGRITGWIANYIEHKQDKYPLTRPCDF